jgi:hypothetical protein
LVQGNLVKHMLMLLLCSNQILMLLLQINDSHYNAMLYMGCSILG